MCNLENHIALLFSGGRDSSLSACLLAQTGAKIHLISTFNGAVVKSDISDYRYKELCSTFPENIIKRITIPSYSLFRRIALANIEDDFAKYKKNLIPVGDGISSHTEAIIYCLKNNIKTIASGYTKYESHYPEQMFDAVKLMHEFTSEYQLSYLTPVFDYGSLDEVKYRLFDFGISTKSLEGTSIFSDTYSIPAPEVVVQYILEKLPICRDYIAFKLKQTHLENSPSEGRLND